MSFWYKCWAAWVAKTSATTIPPALDRQQHQISTLKQQLFLAEQQIEMITMDQDSSTLPTIIERMQQNWADHLTDLQLGIIYCFPFSHECFLYHSSEQYPGKPTFTFLQQFLLRKSIQADEQEIIQYPVPCSEQFFSAKLIAKNHNRLIWRIYMTRSRELYPCQKLQDTDQSLSSALQYWLNLHDTQQYIIEKERREFAAELHDSIAQILGFLRLKSAQLHQTCKNDTKYHDLLECSHELANYTHYAYQQTRDLITASRLIHQELDFSVALKKIIDEFSTQSAIDFELDNRVSHFNISAKHSMQLVYIIRESLSNIVRHSQATSARIHVDKQQEKLSIYIDDNGIGIHPENRRSDSFGLEIMHERAERIGAELRIIPNHPQGTTVVIQLDSSALKDM